MVQGQPGQKQKFVRPPSQPIAELSGTPLSSQILQEAQIDSRQKVRPYLQNNQSKKGWEHDSSGKALCLAREKP
jgi:hypothetical protein